MTLSVSHCMTTPEYSTGRLLSRKKLKLSRTVSVAGATNVCPNARERPGPAAIGPLVDVPFQNGVVSKTVMASETVEKQSSKNAKARYTPPR